MGLWPGIDGAGAISVAQMGGGAVGAVGAVALWWDPNGAGLPIVAAYRAINTPGSPWPLAPTTYAESRQDWSGNQPQLVEGNGAVPWAAGSGWGFVVAAAQWLDTGIVPANDQSYTVIVQYASVASSGFFCGTRSGFLSQRFGLSIAALRVYYYNGGAALVVPTLVTGNLAVSGSQGYRNGAPEGGAIAAWGGASAHSIYIGGRNDIGVFALPVTADILALAIYDTAALTAPQVLAVANAMAAL